MAQPVTTQIQIGEITITEFTHLTISQSLFGHHHFSLGVPFDRLEGTKGTFFSKAHKQLCGQRITVSFAPAYPAGPTDKHAKRSFDFAFQGIVTDLELGNQGDLTGSFQVQGYSPTYLLDRTPIRTTFHKQTLKAIFQQVLQPHAGGLLPLQAKPTSRGALPYVVQYDESAFQFLHRLAAQYGEWFYYDGRQLQLGKPSGKKIPFVNDGVRSSLNIKLSLRHSSFVVAQYSLPQHQTLRASSAGHSVPWLPQNPLATFALQQSERLFPEAMHLPPPISLETQPEVNQVAARYKSQHATSLVQCSGWGENPDVQLGSVLDATGEGLGTNASGEESFGQYLVTSIVHTVDAAGRYANQFEAVPWSTEHPPLGPHRKAPVGQPELAEVIDLQDPQHLGRVRVRYYWPVEKPVRAESTWLRVSTPYSGDGKGQMFTPEVGSQVLIGYENNRAEQPLILGNLFHPQNKQGARYTTEGNHLKGLQTAGGNKVVMSDKKGEQTILLSNSNNKGTAVSVSFKGDGSVHIHSNGPVTVNGSVITLDAGEKGEIKMLGKTITMVAEDDVAISSKNKGVSLSAKEKMAFTAKELLAAGSKSATVQSDTELALNGGSKATLQSGDTKVH